MNLYNVCMFDAQALPEDLQAARALIATLQAQAKTQAALLESKANELSVKANELSVKTNELSIKDKQIQEQAHSVLEIQADRDKLQAQNVDLELRVTTGVISSPGSESSTFVPTTNWMTWFSGASR